MKQSHYIEDNPCTSSIYNQRLLDPVVPHEPIFDDNFAQQIGTLGYLRRTRPDVCVALGVSAQFAKKALNTTALSTTSYDTAVERLTTAYTTSPRSNVCVTHGTYPETSTPIGPNGKGHTARAPGD